MPLSATEKAKRKRERLLQKAKEYTLGTYIRDFVSPVFQRMIRAEAGADRRTQVLAVVDGQVTLVKRKVGQCVCVTCGKVDAWDSGIRGIHTGHFLASRRNSILFEEDNVAPQCSSCNYHRGGAPEKFTLWMKHVRGQPTVDHLIGLKTESRQFTREELVDMRISYQERLKKAEARMECQG